MVKRHSPRILAASALAVLVVGLSGCGTPQTLIPYTPAEGVNADAPRLGGPVDTARTEVPLKLRNLAIVSEPGSNRGFLSGALAAPNDRSDELVSVSGRTFTVDNTPGQAIAPVNANLELPAGRMVILTQVEPIQLSAAELTPGLVAELTLTFRDSEAQTLQVPIVDASKPDYATVTPGPGGEATPAPAEAPGGAPAATPGANGAPAENQPAPAETQPAPAAPATPQ